MSASPPNWSRMAMGGPEQNAGHGNQSFTPQQFLIRDLITEASPPRSESDPMSDQDRYIDARLAGIESKLDARMDAMQRFQERAEDRFQRATERHEAGRQQIHQEFKEARKEMSQHAADTRRHATSTAWGTVAGVFGAIAIIAAVFAYWTAEQGSYAKSYGENQVQMQQAVDERAEFREAVKSIQATQQSILERLPQAEPPSQ